MRENQLEQNTDNEKETWIIHMFTGWILHILHDPGCMAFGKFAFLWSRWILISKVLLLEGAWGREYRYYGGWRILVQDLWRSIAFKPYAGFKIDGLGFRVQGSF